MEDLTVRRIAKKIFSHIWTRHKLMPFIHSGGIVPYSDVAHFSQEIGDTVTVYLHMYRPTLANYLKKHLPTMPNTKLHFWTHVAFFCLQVRLINDNVFDYFLTTCSITAEVALHCYMKGYEDVLSFASVFFCAFFENELYNGFHKAGGWLKLRHYIQETSCCELYSLVDNFIKDLKSPSDHLPILIKAQNEQLAAERREKIVPLQSFKIGEIERDGPTKSLVSGIFYWDFMENLRISESKPGILKRMKNIRHKKNKPNIAINEELSDESSEADQEQNADIERLGLDNIAQSTKSDTTLTWRSDNEDVQESKFTKRSKHRLFSHNETSEEIKLGSSLSLHELCDFYENLSASSRRTTDDSKSFRSNKEKRSGFKSSSLKEMTDIREKFDYFETCTTSVSLSSESDLFVPGGNIIASETASESIKSFHADYALSDFSKSFEELGFKCLCVGNSSEYDENFASFKNSAEIIEKCRYFQNKYPTIQFSVLIPNNCSENKAIQTPTTEKCNEICFYKPDREQQFSKTTKEDFTNRSVSRQKYNSETKKLLQRFTVTKIDENPIGSANGHSLLQDNQKSRFIVRKVEANGFRPNAETSKISRFSVAKVNENQMVLKDEKSSVGIGYVNGPMIISRFKVTKVNENQSNEGRVIPRNNGKNETTKISRFTVTKVDGNQSKDGTSILKQSGTNETTKISSFTITKVDGNQSKGGTGILRQSGTNETAKISRFTITKIDENHSKDETSLLRQSGTKNKMPRFTVKKVDENQLMSRAWNSSLRKGYPNYTTKVSKFDESQTCLSDRNCSTSSQISDGENEAVQYQDNGIIKYQKRVSFAEHPFISYYCPSSSDESSNSSTSKESLDQNPQEDAESARYSVQSSCQEGALRTPTPPAIHEKSKLFQRHSSGDSCPSTNNEESSKVSCSIKFFESIFKSSSSGNPKPKESSKEQMEEMPKQNQKNWEIL